MNEATSDATLPQKTERPRDEYGRPLPHGAAPRLVLPNFDVLSVEACHRLGVEFFEARTYFGAHEAWETAWRLVRADGGVDEEFFKGLSQLGAGYTHYQRGNPRGAHTLMARGVGRIRDYGAQHLGIAIEVLAAATEANMARLEGLTRDDPLPALDLPAASAH